MNWSVYKYVQKYFQNNFPEWYLMSNEQKKDFSKCVNELLEAGAKINDIKSGLYNNELSQKLNEYVNNYFTLEQRKDCKRLCEYIYELSSNSELVNFRVKYSNDVLDHIIKQVMVELFPQYSEARLGTGEFEQVVVDKYKEKYIEKFNKVRNKIKLYLEKNLDFYQVTNINMNDLINYVSSQILINNDYKFVLSVINLKMGDSKNKGNIEETIDKYADKYIVSKQVESSSEKVVSNQENVQTHRIVDVNDYISRLVNDNYQDVTPQLLNSCVRVVKSRLMLRGYDTEQIVSKNNQNVVIGFIDSFFEERQARIEVAKNSVKSDKVPPKIKTDRKTRAMNKSVVTLVLIASLCGLAGNGVYQMVTDIQDFNAKKNVTMIDDHYYANIHTIYAQSFEPTAKNVIDTFDEYSDFEEDNYKYLGFYQAYRSVKQDRLYVMDNMLSEIRKDVRNNDNHRNLSASIMYNGCYLDFMYDRLYEMGFEEIKDDKYQDLLDEYVSIRNEHPYEDVVKYLSPSQERLLEKVRDKYIELSEKYLVELGKLLGSEEYVVEVNNGRSL